MEPEEDARRRFASALRLAAALAIAAWRLFSRSPSDAWRDWILILALLDLISTAAGPGRVRAGAFAAATAFLLGLYGWGQGAQTLRLLGLLP
jgi:hypothetical protein